MRQSTLLLMMVLASSEGLSGQVRGECYDVELGPWFELEQARPTPSSTRPSPDEVGDSLNSTIPSRIQLDRRRGRFNGTWRAGVPEGTLGVPHKYQYWRIRQDTLVVGFSTGFTGTLSKLVSNGTGWRGQAQTFADYPRLEFGRSISLQSVDCAVPPRVSDSLDLPVLRRLEASSGAVLELGERLPSSVPVLPRPTGAWTAQVEATGPWADHDTVVVRLDEQQVVHHIELRYPSGHDLTPILDSLFAVAPPTDSMFGEPRWINRSTKLTVHDSARPRIIMLDPRYF